MSKLKISLIVVSSLGVIFFFQNCSDVSFSTYGADSVGKNTVGDETLVLIEDEAEDEEADAEVELDVTEVELEVAEEDYENAYGGYICILEGHGKSVRLGYADGVLFENGSTPQTLCMSKRACLDIVSKKFSVASAEKRGFCPNKNPHVKYLDDEKIASLLDNQ